MKIATSAAVGASRELVFAALNDRGVLRRAIPGCEDLTDIDADTFEVRLKVGVAGITGKYAGTATLQGRRPPEALTLAFDGKGKSGFVHGTAAVTIVEENGVCRVDCDADVQIGGAIAAVGSRLIAAVAGKLTRDFFRQLADAMGVEPEPLGGAAEPLAVADPPDE